MWILAFGGLGISLGVGRKKVIMTIGSESTGKMTLSFRFCVECFAAVLVLIASLREIDIPVSTSHCQIGGVVGAGIAKGLVDTQSFVGAFWAIKMISGILNKMFM